MCKRTWIDNTELMTAAECLESYARALEDEGDVEGALAQRDTAAAFRHISELSLRVSPTETDIPIAFPSITIAVRGTSEPRKE